jgi:cytochrome c-type biogenesis protein CcmF
MIAELGLAALWLAATLALLQMVSGWASWTGSRVALATLIKPVAVAQGLLCLVSFAALMWLFYVTDLSVLLVASNSHIDKPMIFKLAGTWGNHEGSMLLWVTVLTMAGAAIALFEKRLDKETLAATLFAQALLARFFRIPALFVQPVSTRKSGA